MAPITIAMVNRCIDEVIVSTVRHAARAVEAQLAEEFCGGLAKAKEEITFKVEDKYIELELLYHRLNELNELFHTGHIEVWVLHALHERVAHLCAAQEVNFREYQAILQMEQHFDEENTKEEDIVHDLEVRQIVLLAVRDELSQREAGEVDTFLQGIDLTL